MSVQMQIRDTYERFTVIRSAQLTRVHNILDIDECKSTVRIMAELHADEIYLYENTIRSLLRELELTGRAECISGQGYRRLERA